MANLSDASKGVGKVFAGTKFIGEFQYDFGLYRGYDDDGIPEPLSPNLHITNPPQLPGERLTLHMINGLKLDFVLSPNGSCELQSY